MNRNFDINKLSVAKPCSMSWESMSGDDRMRMCNACEMNIYNLSEMTEDEIVSLIETREGRLCGKIVRRADGTIMTKDCPPGIRAYRQRISRFAGATLATILGLFSFGYGQTKDVETTKNKTAEITRTENQKSQILLKGAITDQTGVIIPGANISIKSSDGKFSRTTTSSDKGIYEFLALPEGKYELTVTASNFKTYKVMSLVIVKDKVAELNIALEVGEIGVVVGIFLSEPLIDTSSTGKKRVISGKKLRKLPINK